MCEANNHDRKCGDDISSTILSHNQAVASLGNRILPRIGRALAPRTMPKARYGAYYSPYGYGDYDDYTNVSSFNKYADDEEADLRRQIRKEQKKAAKKGDRDVGLLHSKKFFRKLTKLLNIRGVFCLSKNFFHGSRSKRDSSLLTTMMTTSAADSDLDGNYYGGDYFLGSAGSSSSAASSSAPITNSVVPMPTILEEPELETVATPKHRLGNFSLNGSVETLEHSFASSSSSGGGSFSTEEDFVQ